QRVFLAVQGQQGFARAAPQGQNAAGEFVHVEDVQRTAKVESEEVGDIDQRVDRPQPDAGQACLQPFGTGGVLNAPDGAADDPWTRLGKIDVPMRAAIEHGGNGCRFEWFQGPQSRCCQVAGDAADAETVAPVGGDADLDDRV